MKLKKNRCKCSHCGEYFNSLRGFDKHRMGSFKDRGIYRRCLTIVELVARGWSKNKEGFWITETHAQRRSRAAAPRVYHRLLH
jgi:hypothetical protein